ncbi:hypothetical protein PDE_09429 [Penicillium oxalicum 114-2]|uniref:DUF7779 domain-containing protein n=1 Tax=Penicillium oxalicum (strain 114-2 / CGMCC 5302) TaxID=933388 RepID=S7ZUR8_PENO1|nr:hypothetical protein PDE_09429 [Penicillium oxalicum 114-2]
MNSTFIEGNHNSGLVVGANSGTINFTHPATQPESRPEPLMTVPFAHDPDFVTRDQLDQLHKKSSIVGSRTALVGLGGVGKSRLAIEYCHRVQQQLPKTWIFWVHASNAARCEQSLRDLADRAKIPGRQDRNTNIFQLFANWLKDGKIGQWILVLDNVDDDTLLSEPSRTRVEAQAKAQDFVSMRPPLRYLLDTSNGSIIITSRDKGVALKATGTMKHLIDVQPMNMTEALRLMQRKLDPYAESTELVQLIEELEFMPLAIVQAASYIIHHSPRCSVSQYLAKLRHSERQARTLLNREEYDAGRDSEAKNSISLTWQISFDHIRQIRQSAADLLSLMSFFDRQGIPEDVLRVAKKTRKLEPEGSPQDIEDISSGVDTDSSSELDDDDDFESDIATLRDYSLIATGENDVEFTMHRLVQLTVRTWLKMHGLEEEWKERFISNLHGIFPTGDYENWEQCRSLFPHVRSTILHRPKSDGSIRTWADLLYRGAWYALVRGNFVDSREMAALSRKQMLKLGGTEDKDALKSTAILAMAYREEGRWGEAEQLFAQVMETSKTKLGADHHDTLMSMANLASTLCNQGRWEEAEQLEVQVMETRKTKLGADHPNTLTSMANLAFTWKSIGRSADAIDLLKTCVLKQEQILGLNHPHTLSSSKILLEWETRSLPMRHDQISVSQFAFCLVLASLYLAISLQVRLD